MSTPSTVAKAGKVMFPAASINTKLFLMILPVIPSNIAIAVSVAAAGPITIPKVNFSIYCSLSDKKVDRIQYDVGVYQEYLFYR